MSEFHYIVLFLVGSGALFAQEKEPAKVEPAKPEVLYDAGSDPSKFTKISGTWKSFQYKGKSVISLSPEPVQECRIELGSYLRSYDISISAKFLAREKSRLKPRMGVGLFGKNGFFLRLAPGRKCLELVQYGEVIAEAPLRWKSQVWQHLELTVIAGTTHWKVIGKTWSEHQSKPEKPTIEKEVYPSSLTHPLSGRPFLTGSPFGGYPILYDEVIVHKLPEEKSAPAK